MGVLPQGKGLAIRQGPVHPDGLVRIVQHRLPVRTVDRRCRQAAVAADDGGQSLLEFQLSEIRPKHRAVSMAVDINKSRGHHAARRINDPLCRPQIFSDGGDFSVPDCQIGGERLPAASIYQAAVSYHQIVHANLLSRSQSCIFFYQSGKPMPAPIDSR